MKVIILLFVFKKLFRQSSTSGRTSLPDRILPERQVAGKQHFKSMIEKEFSDNQDQKEEELFQIKAK